MVLAISTIGIPVPAMGSEVWPQKSTAPYYCLDGGKGWKASDRYEIYLYNTLPAPLTEIQAKRLFWAYPSNWDALKEAAAKYDIELYQQIASTVSNPNIVKRVKDDAGTKFAWVADHPEIEDRAIRALEQVALENSVSGKEVPEPIREATSEETAASFFVPALCEGPGALNTEFKLSSEFIRDIAKIEAQSVWDNGSTGGNVGWLDASQDKNIAKAVLGDELYEITWSGDSIKIHNNGSAVANENVVGGNLTEEQMYNKTTVRYKITMRESSGWYTDGSWDQNYLTEWMDFKACVNAPEHQRLYKADIRIVPSDMVFYLVVSQGPIGDAEPRPEYGSGSTDVDFQVYRHEERFEANYNEKLRKIDDETGKPLKGSQFYVYERFEDAEKLKNDEANGGLSVENLSFTPWQGFQVFAEGTTNENGEITYTDTRNYTYAKTYCDGHGMPKWVEVPEQEEVDGSDEADGERIAEEARDQNRKAAKQWLDVFESCKEAEEELGGTHFHWEIDEDYYDAIMEIEESGESEEAEGKSGASAKVAFERSGCKEDCEQTYEAFINLRFTYTWKEIQARNGYILHGVHPDDNPIHFVTTVSSEAGADAYVSEGDSSLIQENIWYSGNHAKVRDAREVRTEARSEDKKPDRMVVPWSRETDSNSEKINKDVMSISDLDEMIFEKTLYEETDSNSISSASDSTKSDSNAKEAESIFRPTLWEWFVSLLSRKIEESDDDDWGEMKSDEDFESYLNSAESDGIRHLDFGKSNLLSYADKKQVSRKFWEIRDHRTEGEIHINKRDMDLYKEESDDYSSYADTEGDGTVEGAQYGLFAAEDIIHPDSDMLANGKITNTGIVYKKNDLVAVAVTDAHGNAEFGSYTVAPGMTFDYETEQIIKRPDQSWSGPENLYIENREEYGNWWIGRPLILGSYYVKELSRSEGYELSVNGTSQKWTNYGSSFDTPEGLLTSSGTAIISLPELAASMEGENETGNGYDQFTFSVTSTATSDETKEKDGYYLVLSGFPENTEFYRVDSGETEVTGPHVTGTEKVMVKDSDGNIVWKTADSNTSHVKYQPEYDLEGNVIGQIPMSRMEAQTQTFEQIPQAVNMAINNIDLDAEESFWKKLVMESNVDDEESETFGILKSELETILSQNGYDVPVTADGIQSKKDSPVFSVGVVAGQNDIYGMTTVAGQPAVKTVYGAALQEVVVQDVKDSSTFGQLFGMILSWYQEHPHWNFGGLHEIKVEDENVILTLYAGISNITGRSFFTMVNENGQSKPGAVYTVLENSKTLRWEYQEYQDSGDFRYKINEQYFLNNGINKRYYLDATLAPAVMIDREGERKIIEHQVMVFHDEGEEIIDYLNGSEEHGYRVPLTELVDKIEITTENEFVEQDVPLEDVLYDRKTGTYRISIRTTGVDSFGTSFSDIEQSLKLTFMVKLPENKRILNTADLGYIGSANVYGYREGMEIGYAEYLMRFTDAAIQISIGNGKASEDTYIVQKSLVYRGQEKVGEDGDTAKIPVQVLERPIKQKVKIKKKIENEEPIGNFRFKIYLKSNLERLYRNDSGEIIWLDQFGNYVDVKEYKDAFPELVQNFYTKNTGIRLLEDVKKLIIDPDGTETKIDTYNYEKFFDAIAVANKDKWKNEGFIWNTSWKPFVTGFFSGIQNEINTSEEARENAKRSDAVRQFAVDWYLNDEVELLTIQDETGHQRCSREGTIAYSDEIYDKALYQAILKAEDYLRPFFQYDLDYIYGIQWDSEEGGGVDQDLSTLSADQIMQNAEEAYAISKYLPYGNYVIVEQQPYRAEWNDLANRHFEIDEPKELSLPQCFDKDGVLQESADVPWSMTEPGSKTEMSGYAEEIVKNKRYFAKLRIEKLDAETGENILHDGAVFALYRAERNEGVHGDGSVKRYDTDTIISGSQPFLVAMGAKNITSFARFVQGMPMGIGVQYTGMVPKGTPICKEEQAVILDLKNQNVLQTTGYLETPEPIESGVYVLAELKAPSGYVRSKPIPVEVYSDQVQYYPNGGEEKASAVSFVNRMDKDGALTEKETETVRIFVNDIATSLEVSKIKTSDSYRGMKISGRVEGSIAELDQLYGLENLELAYRNGKYLGFAWKKGTLEYLENRKEQGERIQLVYEAGVFQGYGYVTRRLETEDDENRYVAGAQLALYNAVSIRRSGDTEDFTFSGVQIQRDKYGAVKRITVKEGEEIPVLFYDLSNLEVLQKSPEGELYGFDRNGQKMKVTFDTESIFAVRNGQAVFEITGGLFDELVYSAKDRAFTKISTDTIIYHLDEELRRDAQVDGYTGLAYVEKTMVGERGENETRYYAWTVTELKDEKGEIFAREKQLTGRPGEVDSGTSQAYITGSVQGKTGVFEKQMNPIVNEFGLVEYYPSSTSEYKKGQEIFDRDGEKLGFQYDDLLDKYGLAGYRITEDPELYGEEPLLHRQGESWIIPNTWTSGTENPQDPNNLNITTGQADLLRRVEPGSYIMEELDAPKGYVRALPVAVQVEECAEVQRVSMVNEKTKVEIAKVESKGNRIGELIENVELALYKAKRVYTTDYEKHPKGYYLEKEEQTPACWYTEGTVDNQPILIEALWISGKTPKYFEGIPVGDYILEERWTPDGYVPASMEITVQERADLQSFIFINDHMKLEVFKYEEVQGTLKQPLQWPAEAELTLYPAVLDSNGVEVIVNGEPAYEDNSIIRWKTGSCEKYKAIVEAYEDMYEQYSDTFDQFSWKFIREGGAEEGTAVLIESTSTANKETIIQFWKLNNDTLLRVVGTIGDKDSVDRNNPRTFSYQFQYQQGEKGTYPYLIGYETQNGLYRLDYIPTGSYVLVETKTPEGYEQAKPMLVKVEETADVQRVNLENKKLEAPKKEGKLVIHKIDGSRKEEKLAGAVFEVRNLQDGTYYRIVTDDDGCAVLENLPVYGTYESGIEGPCIYEIQEIQAPEGYCLDSAVHRIRFSENPEEAIIHHEMTVENYPTEISVSKTNFKSGHFVEGAYLAIYQTKLENGIFVAEGEPIEKWISTNEPHKIIGKLSGGRTYLLVEEKAANGFSPANPIRFTISGDGKRITSITEDMSTVHIRFKEGTEDIESILITGRMAMETKTMYSEEDEISTLSEWLCFSDGEQTLLERETFRKEKGSRTVHGNGGRYPIGTEYCLLNSEGVRMDRWKVTAEAYCHEILNEKNREGKLRFEAGNTYYLEEEVLFSDGTRMTTGRMKIQLGDADGNAGLEILNRETDVRIKKTDMVTGKELPGAEIVIKTLDGDVIDSWISDEEEHVIKGILSPGVTYILSETTSADGYAYAEEILFTIHEKGLVERVIMEDRPTNVEIRKVDLVTGEELSGAKLMLKDREGNIVDQWISEAQPHWIKGQLIAGEEYTLVEEIAPEGYLIAEEVRFTVSMDGRIDRVVMEDQRERQPEESDEPSESPKEEPKTVPEVPEESEKIGLITAYYEPEIKQRGAYKLLQPMGFESVRTPKTGDESTLLLPIMGLVISSIGFGLLNRDRRKHHER